MDKYNLLLDIITTGNVTFFFHERLYNRGIIDKSGFTAIPVFISITHAIQINSNRIENGIQTETA